MNKRVLIGMSGGMDSAVAAALLKTQGYEVVGVHFQLQDPVDQGAARPGGCCMRQAHLAAVEKLCAQLEISLHVVNAKDDFHSEALDYFVHETLVGHTANPCVRCVGRIKVAGLIRKADQLHCNLVATGHYAKIVRNPDGSETNVLRSTDPKNDQSYFLFDLKQEQLARLITPLGDLLGTNVEKMARTFKLPVIEKKAEFQTCFVDDPDNAKIIEKNAPERYRPGGLIVSRDGQALGRHNGIYYYHLGQTRPPGVEKPEFIDKWVVGFDVKLNVVIVGDEKDLERSGLVAINCNWIGIQDFSRGIKATAKIGPNREPAECIITLLNNNSVLVDFKSPQRLIMPGQAIVFYQEEILIGGGWIEALTDPVTTKLSKRTAFVVSQAQT